MKDYKTKVTERRDGEIIKVEFYSAAGRLILTVIKSTKCPLEMTATKSLDESDKSLVGRIVKEIFGERSESKLQQLFDERDKYKSCTLTYSDEKRLFYDVCKLPYTKAKPKPKQSGRNKAK